MAIAPTTAVAVKAINTPPEMAALAPTAEATLSICSLVTLSAPLNLLAIAH